MSLIVAKKIDGKIFIVSDTKLFFNDEELRNLKEGALKTVLLNKNVSISFAGDVEFAISALEIIYPTDDIKTIIQKLYDWHKFSGEATEFIVTYFEDIPIICEIKEREAINVESSWIGDYEAFRQFQIVFNSNKASKTDVAAQTIATISNGQDNDGIPLYQAMAKVFMEKGITSVGGFPILVSHRKDDLRYADYTSMYTAVIDTRPEVNKSLPINFVASAAEGGYSINVFPCDYMDKRNLAIHILQGKVGIIYSQKQSYFMEASILPMEQFDFLDYCIENFNCGMPGAYFGNREDFYASKAFEFNKNMDYDGEIKYWSNFININRTDPRVFYNRGLAYLKVDKVQESINDFLEVTRLEDSELKGKALMNIGEIHLRNQQTSIADSYFSQAIIINPKLENKITEIKAKYR